MHAKTAKILILTVLLLFPSLATRLFTLLKCEEVQGIPGKQFLEADWSVECFVGEHATMAGVGALGFVLYIVGIPVAMVLVLLRVRNALHDPAHPNHLHVMYTFGGLYAQYEPKFWWFEFAIMIHKTLLTGAVCLIGRQSIVQPLAATLFQLIFLLLVLKLSPVGILIYSVCYCVHAPYLFSTFPTSFCIAQPVPSNADVSFHVRLSTVPERR